jgi:hypothetical protein
MVSCPCRTPQPLAFRRGVNGHSNSEGRERSDLTHGLRIELTERQLEQGHHPFEIP